jgi:hypothetical protein
MNVNKKRRFAGKTTIVKQAVADEEDGGHHLEVVPKSFPANDDSLE